MVNNMKKKLLYLGLIATLFLGCTAKYMPIPSSQVVISEYLGIVNTPEYQFAAENRYWSYEPDEFSEYFISFYVVLRNRSESNLQVSSADFVLIDEAGNQFDAIPNDYLERLTEPSQLELYNDSTLNGSHFFDEDEVLHEEQSSLEKWQKARENLIRYVFRYGELRPGARKSGYLFFPKMSERNQSCRVIYKESEIEFSKLKDKK